VIFQAGGSPRGVELAAKTAEAVFMNAIDKPTLKKQVDALREKAVEFGRDPEHIATLQMITVISAATDEEAQAKYREYLNLVSYDGAMARYSGWTGLDMASFDPDKPLKDVEAKGTATMLTFFQKVDAEKEWTPRDIAEYTGIGGTSPVIVGGPETVADELSSWMEQTGISGFNIANALKFQDIKDFTEFVVPELQKRGAMRTSFSGPTLREHLFGEGVARLPEDHPGSAYRKHSTEARKGAREQCRSSSLRRLRTLTQPSTARSSAPCQPASPPSRA
jgi:alkanesulfonate monooxygenase SsuD/methylene tetrahydromethanopterin reductase-like flavin-dependent oxidoreductase (luciferase family)